MELGLVGLGKMGSHFALQAASKNLRVTAYSKEVIQQDDLIRVGVHLVSTLTDCAESLTPPRNIFLYVPAGRAVDQVLDVLWPSLSRGDVIIDGGNSYYRDSMYRNKWLASKGIGFVDCGSSGGPEGALKGACFMVGGSQHDVNQIEPILKCLAVPDGYLHVGPPGSGHFVKLIHNAIEFGMLQAIGEGTSMLAACEFDLNLPAIFHNWAHGSVIRGWLVELMEQGLRKNPKLVKVPGFVEDTGEVNWAIEEALRLEVPIPVIAQSVFELFASRSKDEISQKSVAILRNGFGEHPFGENRQIAKYRKESRIRGPACDSDGQ